MTIATTAFSKAQGPGLLVADRWANGWRAGVNGKPAQVFGGDFIFRALAVKAGKNTVKLSYRPAGWPGLLLLSWGLLVTVLLLTLWQLVNPGLRLVVEQIV